MTKNFLAAAAALGLMLGTATAASATTFTGSYDASYNTKDSKGLPISTKDLTTPGRGNAFSFPLTAGGSSTTLSLFDISTDEDELDSNDGTHKTFSLTFNFTSPSTASGGVTGSTYGETVFGSYEEGVLTWNNGGDTTVDFGNLGLLSIHLDDLVFNKTSQNNNQRDRNQWNNDCDDNLELGNSPGVVKATFSLKSAVSAVPEPMTWALMLTGFMGLGAALRANRRQGLALAAAK